MGQNVVCFTTCAPKYISLNIDTAETIVSCCGSFSAGPIFRCFFASSSCDASVNCQKNCSTPGFVENDVRTTHVAAVTSCPGGVPAANVWYQLMVRNVLIGLSRVHVTCLVSNMLQSVRDVLKDTDSKKYIVRYFCVKSHFGWFYQFKW